MASSKLVLTIYAMPGSQFTGKVLAALDARKIDHYCVFVPMQLEQRKKFLPSGGTLVPEMKAIVEDGDPQIVSDSEAILHWLDDNLQTKLFPTPEASDLSKRASDNILAGAVWYYNWVDEEGYRRSMLKSMSKAMLPSFVPAFIGDFVLNKALKSTRAKFRLLALEALGVDEAAMEDRDQIRKVLMGELEYFQSLLKEEPYLLGKESTAPDFSVYAQVERLVGDMGDAGISCSIPELKEETSLAKFWKWYDYMRENHPLKFRGKRAPQE